MEEKKWWQSKTVWGGIVAIGGAVAGAFGIAVDEATQGEIVDYIMVIAGAAGGLLAIYGRLKAEKKIN
ncbi:MAG TPA: hypothetical protein PK728_09505 [Bacillota bacterium]|nr:hypothetical protein [Bacillota bacterium]